MTKPTFKPRTTAGLTLAAVEYTPLIYIAGTEAFRFALHKQANSLLPDARKEWVVSEPVTGMQVCVVRGDLGGIAVSSRGLPPRRARAAAMDTLDQLLERVGSVAFSEKINTAKAALSV